MPPPTPLDDVEFLARSAHRVEVLRTLRSGPWTRPDLHDETGVSQPTLGRVLGSLEDRHWVERRGREYALTPLGEVLAAEFDDLLGTVETIQRLGGVIGLLPTDEMAFDVRRFASATITTPEPGDVLRHVRRAEEVLRDARDLRILADTIAPSSLEEGHDRVMDFPEGDLVFESIITGDAIDQTLAEPDLVGLIRDLVASGRAPIYRYDGTIPLTVVVADDTAVLFPTDEQGLPAALIETDDEAVRAWVAEQIDRFRDRAIRLTLEDLPA